jgi:hypothetical protein
MRLEWQPDSMTNIMFRPNFSYTTNDGINKSEDASFDKNPFDYSDDPLTDVFEIAKKYGIAENYSVQSGTTYSDSKNLRGM